MAPQKRNHTVIAGQTNEFFYINIRIFFLKIRIVLAVLLMLAFLLLKYNAYEFHGYQAKDVIDIISDNQYYTILQDYVMINEHD